MVNLAAVLGRAIGYAFLGGLAGGCVGCVVGGVTGLCFDQHLRQAIGDGACLTALTWAGPWAVMGLCDGNEAHQKA